MNEASEHGYTIRFRLRAIKTRRRQNGRARGFYEGKYIYIRVKGPDGVERDIYLGTETESKAPAKKRVENFERPRARATSPAKISEGRTRGQEDPMYAIVTDPKWSMRPRSTHNGRSVNDVKGVPNR